jgi:hypothetical protein
MTRFTTHLPNAVIGFSPIFSGRIDYLGQEIPIIVIRGFASFMPVPCQIKKFSVNIQLQLFFGSVPHANGLDFPIALQFFHLILVEPSFTPHAENNLEFLCATGSGPLDKPAESVSLVNMTDVC